MDREGKIKLLFGAVFCVDQTAFGHSPIGVACFTSGAPSSALQPFDDFELTSCLLPHWACLVAL